MEDIVIKGTKQGLVFLINPELSTEEIRQKLIEKLEANPGFFQGAKFSLQAVNGEKVASLDSLEGICVNHGLVNNPHLHWDNRYQPPKSSSAPQLQSEQIQKLQAEVDWEKARIYPNLLRSGQKIAAPEALIILGNVHAGAEVEAGGSVLILGNCQGKIKAGQKNSRQTVIIAKDLKTADLQIGSLKSELSPNLSGFQVAYLSQNQLKIEKYTP